FSDGERSNEVSIEFDGSKIVSERDLRIDTKNSDLNIEVLPQSAKDVRVDIKITLPERLNLSIETNEGAINLIGDFAEVTANSNTGTIYADVSLENLDYRFQWMAAKPRYMSDVDLEDVKEKAAGRYQIKGKLREVKKAGPVPFVDRDADKDDVRVEPAEAETEKPAGRVSLDFTTVRGIILLNVNPGEVPSNLQERPLTEAARSIIRSGDAILVNAIRRSSPKFFGEYAATLPPRNNMPTLSDAEKRNDPSGAGIRKVTVQVTDINNRAIPGLSKNDFSLTERGDQREIISVESASAPFNLVLLLDVSGSIEHYVDFIRKAARNFINTTSPEDRIAIIIFNDDVKPLSVLTKDRKTLSESLDTFDAGGGTAYYDSLAYALTETLRPLKGDRTAIVALSDGDDNRSFLPFSALIGAIQESGALIYPLYVPSGLIAASQSNDPAKAEDPMRSRFMALTSKAQEEGETLAKVSGGVYYPISRLSELQEAYDDIVLQLRTAYTITYRSDSSDVRQDMASPRLKVKVNRDTAFVKIGPIVEVRK
ncbi:MAG: VWA domain-containing protein, partial [Acidobacteria bacterium]|nr:VWA domain-containing protein [Acidobacteriota bacterium]